MAKERNTSYETGRKKESNGDEAEKFGCGFYLVS